MAGPSSSQTDQESEEENSDEEDESSEDEDAEEKVQDDYNNDDDDNADSGDEDIGLTATGQGSISYIALSAFTGEEEGDLSIQVPVITFYFRCWILELRLFSCTKQCVFSSERRGFESSF